jgi:hypothetical protein
VINKVASSKYETKQAEGKDAERGVACGGAPVGSADGGSKFVAGIELPGAEARRDTSQQLLCSTKSGATSRPQPP